MVQCSSCTHKTNDIKNIEEAIQCKGCKKFYHKSCGEKMANLGFLENGGLVKCCGSAEEIAHQKEVRKNSRKGSSQISSHFNSDLTSQQMFSQLSHITSANDTDGNLQKANSSKNINEKQDLQLQQQNSYSTNSIQTMYITQHNSQNLNEELDELQNTQDGNKSMITSDQMQNQLLTLWEKIEKAMKSNKKAIIMDISKKMDELASKFDSQQGQIDEIFTRLEKVEGSLETNDEKNIDIAIFEINNRRNREKNLIFFNVKDNNDISMDKQTIFGLFPSSFDPNIIVKVVRLGRNTPSKQTRELGNDGKVYVSPLKVTFSSVDIIQWLFLNKNKIKWNGITFSTDKTLRQREQYNAAKTELNIRKRNGESNLIIKTIAGVPRVVDINSSQIKKNNGHSKNMNGDRNQV